MTDFRKHRAVLRQIDRRTLLGSVAAGVLAKGLGGRGAKAAIGGEDEIADWTPDYITGIADTTEVDTAAECAKVVPLKTKGKLTFWYVGPTHASPPLDKIITTSSGRRSARPIQTLPSSRSASIIIRYSTSCAPTRLATLHRLWRG